MPIVTKPEVFIVESLNYDDEAERCEGKILSDILRMSGKTCEYIYIRTRRELEDIMKRFAASRYRYLHLSCHGNSNSLFTTLDPLPFPKLASIIGPHLKGRRLFVSACSATNRRLAKSLMPESGCTSILGPVEDIDFRTAPLLWASLYYVMFDADETAMKHSVLSVKAQEVANMYRVRLNYIRKEAETKDGYTVHCIRPKREPGTSATKKVPKK